MVAGSLTPAIAAGTVPTAASEAQRWEPRLLLRHQQLPCRWGCFISDAHPVARKDATDELSKQCF